jgi:hypothetical protein
MGTPTNLEKRPSNDNIRAISRDMRLLDQKIAFARIRRSHQSHSIHHTPTTYNNRPPNHPKPKIQKSPTATHFWNPQSHSPVQNPQLPTSFPY